jgi:phosphoglycolate phosphatase-like HAD superfamily hydrolase
MIAPTVALFDLDGTLVTTDGAGRRALERALDAVVGREDLCDFPLGGMTDRAIVRRALQGGGLSCDEAAIDAVLAQYLALLPGEIQAARGYRVLPGVVALLDALQVVAAVPVAVGLGTGNIRPGAEIKLGRADLMRRFAFGGFGSDAEDRAALLRIGAARGAAQIGVAAEACRVVIIGDTPRDIAAAQVIGAECLAVATGPHRAEELRAAGAQWIVDTLQEAQAIAAIRGSAA